MVITFCSALHQVKYALIAPENMTYEPPSKQQYARHIVMHI